jgi:Fe2+ or Zn2+ uptake regulation protein
MSTCKEKVFSVLKRGGRWTNTAIVDVLLSEFNEPNMHNTISKNLHFLIKDGLVQSELVNGKSYCEYWLIREQTKEEILIDKILDAIKNYPKDHIDYRKALLQIEQLQVKRLEVA